VKEQKMKKHFMDTRDTKKWIQKSGLIIGIILIAGGLAFGPSLLAGNENKGSAGTDEIPLFSVKVVRAEKRTLRAWLEVNGDIVSAQETDVFPDVSGKLVKVNASLGDSVRKGDVIAVVDPSKPGAKYMNSPVYAPISGIVSKTPLSPGMTVSPATGITVISAGGSLEIIARIPEREIAGLEPGLAADVSLQAYPGEIFSAAVTRVSPVLDSDSRTKLITLNFTHNDGRINAGMFARLRINTRTYNDVLTVPAEALVTKHGESAVYVARNDGTGPVAERRLVRAGVSLNGLTEIKDGLEEGEAVIVQGQQLLSGGEALRIMGAALAAGKE
jgi:multidrug efflux pump subunit AcrA (membrane-fusion protein)